jgi:hypothetical protein
MVEEDEMKQIAPQVYLAGTFLGNGGPVLAEQFRRGQDKLLRLDQLELLEQVERLSAGEKAGLLDWASLE